MFAFFDLEAINPERNIDRFYSISIDTTLFEEYFITINHGRNRVKGRTKFYYFQNNSDLTDKLIHVLKRRFSAKSRLGVNYELIFSKWDYSFKDAILPSLLEKKVLPDYKNHKDCNYNNHHDPSPNEQKKT